MLQAVSSARERRHNYVSNLQYNSAPTSQLCYGNGVQAALRTTPSPARFHFLLKYRGSFFPDLRLRNATTANPDHHRQQRLHQVRHVFYDVWGRLKTALPVNGASRLLTTASQSHPASGHGGSGVPANSLTSASPQSRQRRILHSAGNMTNDAQTRSPMMGESRRQRYQRSNSGAYTLDVTASGGKMRAELHQPDHTTVYLSQVQMLADTITASRNLSSREYIYAGSQLVARSKQEQPTTSIRHLSTRANTIPRNVSRTSASIRSEKPGTKPEQPTNSNSPPTSATPIRQRLRRGSQLHQPLRPFLLHRPSLRSIADPNPSTATLTHARCDQRHRPFGLCGAVVLVTTRIGVGNSVEFGLFSRT